MEGETHNLPCDDAAEMGRFLAALEPRSYGLARRMVREPDAAADVVQNAFEKVIRCCRQFEGTARPSTWVFRIVLNEALQWLRSGRRRTRGRVEALALESVESSAPAPDEHAAAREKCGRVDAALRRLSDDDQELLSAVVEGRALQSLSEGLGLSLAGVKTRLFRARQKLARELANGETQHHRTIAPRTSRRL